MTALAPASCPSWSSGMEASRAAASAAYSEVSMLSGSLVTSSISRNAGRRGRAATPGVAEGGDTPDLVGVWLPASQPIFFRNARKSRSAKK